MREVNVLIDNFERRKEFVNILEKMRVHAILGHGNSAIDATSLVGVMSIAPKTPILLTIYENDNVTEEVMEKIEHFIV